MTEDPAPEARILGDLSEGDFDEPSVIEAEGVLFYTASKSLSPRAVPKMSGVDVTIPNTKMERTVLTFIDGTSTVSEIEKSSGLSFAELVVALLNLRDKQVIRIDAPSFALPPENEFADADHTVRTEAPDLPRAGDPLKEDLDDPTKDQLEDLPEVSAEFIEHADDDESERDIAEGLEDSTAAELPSLSEPDLLTPESPPPALPEALAKRPAIKLPGITKAPAARAPSLSQPPEAVTAPTVPTVSKAPAPIPTPVVSTPAPSRPRSVANVRVTPRPGETDIETRARRLYEQAIVEKEAGDVLSALNNMKLAFTFCPANDQYKRAMLELQASGVVEAGKRPVGTSKARALYEQATQAERLGDIDKAQELLEKALDISKEAMIYNRLGVILAMRRKDYERGRVLIEKALELAPKNDTYQHNLAKVLARAAAREVATRAKTEPKKGGLLGFLKKT